MKLVIIVSAIGIELAAIILMIFGLMHNLGSNPGVWLFSLGAILALAGGLLFNKVAWFLKGKR